MVYLKNNFYIHFTNGVLFHDLIKININLLHGLDKS